MMTERKVRDESHIRRPRVVDAARPTKQLNPVGMQQEGQDRRGDEMR